MITLRKEYNSTITLQGVLQMHIMFCLSEYYDQILQSDMLTVSCCNCSKDMKVTYDRLVHDIHCKDCQDVIVNAKSMHNLQKRLNSIQDKLMNLQVK